MIEHITPESILSGIRLVSEEDFVYVFVEGTLDSSVLSNMLKTDIVRIKALGGFEKVVETVDYINSNYKEFRAIGIIDSDLDCVQKRDIPKFANLFYTDYHDIETMIIVHRSFELFEKCMLNLDNENKKEKYNTLLDDYKCITDFGMDISKQIAKLRVIEYCRPLDNKYGLLFKKSPRTNSKGLNYKKMIDVDNKSFTYSSAKVFNYVIEFSKNNDVFKRSQINNIFKEYELLNLEIYERNLIINGHDLIEIVYEIFNIILRKLNEDAVVSLVQFQNMLVTNYRIEDFKETKLCKSIDEWSKNENIQILN